MLEFYRFPNINIAIAAEQKIRELGGLPKDGTICWDNNIIELSDGTAIFRRVDERKNELTLEQQQQFITGYQITIVTAQDLINEGFFTALQEI